MRLRLLGVPVDTLSVSQAVSRIVERAADPKSSPAYVLKPYVEFFSRRGGPRVRAIFEDAWICLADGVALQWAAAYQRRSRHLTVDLLHSLAEIVLRPSSVRAAIPERAAGVTFTIALLRACRDRGLGVFLIGSPKHNPITHTAQHLERAFPGLRVVGTAPGRVDLADDPQRVQELRGRRPDVILVGLGFPAQERLMARLVPLLDHGVLIGEGGSFDFRELGGGIRRAPAAVRHLGLEWLWRLLREPWRLRRQLAIPEFVLRVQHEARDRDRAAVR